MSCGCCRLLEYVNLFMWLPLSAVTSFFSFLLVFLFVIFVFLHSLVLEQLQERKNIQYQNFHKYLLSLISQTRLPDETHNPQWGFPLRKGNLLDDAYFSD